MLSLLASSEAIASIALHNRETYSEIKAIVDSYLSKCGRRYVSMDSLFGFMGRMAV
jgi:DNA polymerase alpha subunit A